MPPVVHAQPLAQHRELLPLVGQWFTSEWPGWYGPGGNGNIKQDLEAFASSEVTLPVGMVIFENQKPVGVGVLKAQSIPSHPHFGPWAAAGYVIPSCRGRGLGAVLLQALVSKAKSLGFKHVYCGTSTAVNLLTRAGWQPKEVTSIEDKPLTIFKSAA